MVKGVMMDADSSRPDRAPDTALVAAVHLLCLALHTWPLAATERSCKLIPTVAPRPPALHPAIADPRVEAPVHGRRRGVVGATTDQRDAHGERTPAFRALRLQMGDPPRIA
jgi:hypothetical protein